MLLQLKPLFTGEKENLSVDCSLDFSGIEWQGIHPFSQPVKVQGQISTSADVVVLKAKASWRFDGVCDRCAEPFCRDMETDVEHILVTSLNNEENDDFILLENYQLPLDELVETDVLLSLPSKNLCREDCRGLCPMCGKNLNEGLCGCKPDTVDPRLAVLKQLIN